MKVDSQLVIDFDKKNDEKIVQYTLAEYTLQDFLAAIDEERKLRIFSCSWLIERHRDEIDMGRTTTLTNEQYQQWLTYRQQLRDIPQTLTDFNNFVWPNIPMEINNTV